MGVELKFSSSLFPHKHLSLKFLSRTERNYYADQPVEFYTGFNFEDDVSDLVITGHQASMENYLSARSDSSGEHRFNFNEGQHAIELRVEDPTGKITTESVVVNVGGNNNEPLCEIIESESEPPILGQNISFSGVANDEDINNSLLNISWDQSVWTDTSSANTAGNNLCPMIECWQSRR